VNSLKLEEIRLIVLEENINCADLPILNEFHPKTDYCAHHWPCPHTQLIYVHPHWVNFIQKWSNLRSHQSKWNLNDIWLGNSKSNLIN
jgi:hypothetical protein